MKIAVMGAGAVGCYYGALLARAGHEVVLIARQALVDAVDAHGLRLETRDFDGFVPMQASTEASAVQGADAVLFCVKSGDTERAGAQIAPHLAPHAAVLSLQNGVDNAPRLSQVIGRDAIPVAVYVATEMAGAGHVKHHGRGDLIIGASVHSDAIAGTFNAAGIPTTVSARAVDALWAKLASNCVYNALSAITQLPYGTLAQGENMLAVMRDAFDEVAAVAAASGIDLPATAWDGIVELSRSMAGQRSSTAQDVARGKRSEIDYINGHVVREGARLGIATPVNRVLHALVKLKDDTAAAA